MIRIISITLFIFCFSNLKGQDNQLQINVGIKLNNVYEPPSNNNRVLLGSSIGLAYNKYLNNNLFLSSGLLLNEKGYGLRTNIGTESMDYKVRLFYLDLPIKCNYAITTDNQNIIFGLGPYIGCGLWGNITTAFMGDNETKAVKWGNTGGDYDGTPDHKRLDIGFSGNISYQFNRISIGLDYQIGVVDLVPEGLGGGERNNTFGLHLGYLIKK